jgi:pilus assembly protein Flp/PilA
VQCRELNQVELEATNFRRCDRMTTLAVALRALIGSARDEQGQGLAEYALILVFVAIVVIAALTLLGSNISSVLNSLATTI